MYLAKYFVSDHENVFTLGEFSGNYDPGGLHSLTRVLLLVSFSEESYGLIFILASNMGSRIFNMHVYFFLA